MTVVEKRILRSKIGKLTQNQKRGILDIVRDLDNQKDGMVFEFDLHDLPSIKCRELETYVNKCISDN